MKYLVLLTCLHYCMAKASNRIANATTPAPTRTTAPLTTSSPLSCPDGWIDGGHIGCFYFQSEEKKLNWVEAQGACEMLGGYLAEIKTEEQNNFVESMAIIEESFSGVKSWWLGLNDMGHEGRWIWSHSSTDVEFTSWGPAHPNTATGNQNDCVAITLSEHFHWKDLSCSETHHSSPSPICQRDVQEVTTTEPAPSTTTFPERLGHQLEVTVRIWELNCFPSIPMMKTPLYTIWSTATPRTMYGLEEQMSNKRVSGNGWMEAHGTMKTGLVVNLMTHLKMPWQWMLKMANGEIWILIVMVLIICFVKCIN